MLAVSGDDFWADSNPGTQYGWVVRITTGRRGTTRIEPTAIRKQPIFKASALAARMIVFLLLYFVGLLKKPF